jgi:hypothetical protein
MFGNVAEDGRITHADSQTMRDQLAAHIAAGHANAPRYSHLLKEMMRSIFLIISRNGDLKPDERRLAIALYAIEGFKEKMHGLLNKEKEKLGELSTSSGIMEGMIAEQIRTNKVSVGLLDYLVTEISRSRAKGDAVAKAALAKAPGAEGKRETLRGFPVLYLKKAIVANRDGVTELLKASGSKLGARYEANRDKRAGLNDAVDRATHRLYLDYRVPLLGAYASVVRNAKYYLREEDLREMAVLEQRDLVIYKAHEDGHYVPHINDLNAGNVPAGPPIHVFHSEAHYEQAVITPNV